MSTGPSTRIRVLLLIPHLGTGGAQRVTATLATHLDADKYAVHLALITQASIAGADIPASVRIHCLGARRARYAALRLIALARELRPDLIFIGMAHLAPMALLPRLLLAARTRIVLRQNGALSSLLAALGPGNVSRLILAAAYRRADMIICQTESTAEELKRELRLDKDRVRVLPNPVDIQALRETCSRPSASQ